MTFLNEYLGDAHSASLLTMESSGLVHMIRNNNMDELALVYNMFSRRPASFDLLRKHLAEFIVNEGNKLVNEEVKNEEFVTKMIDLRERVSSVQNRAMQKDTQIDMTIKMAFEKVVNVNNRTAKALVFYLDEMLKKDFKNIQEAELAERLDKVIHIFRYLLDKDVFEGFYVSSFAKRLLEQRQICEEAETALVLKLKEECGCQFTQRLEVMFKDMKMSDELCQEFKSNPASESLEIDFSVKVLTQGHWPNDQKDAQFFQQLPNEISVAMNTFTQFYYSKFNNGRLLNWKLALGNAEIRGTFQEGKRYEFLCSSYQMFLLLLFNENPVITYQQFLQMTQIPAHELHQHLIPLIKQKILVKNPQVNCFSAEDAMQVNVDFRSNMYRNKIAVLNSKTQKETDTKKVQGKVEDDRRYAIEAAMIKVMKARRKIDYTNLMSETTRLLQVRFTPEPAQIKVRLESLIERGYIERAEEDKRVFKYVA